jgi:hypothetical protein
VIAHHRPGLDYIGKYAAKFKYALFDPRLSMLERFVYVRINATKPRALDAAIDAVKTACVRWIHEVAAGVGDWVIG